jgi:hypothetical protein
MSEDCHDTTVVPMDSSLYVPRPEPKPLAWAEQLLSSPGAWYLWVGDELVDICFNAFVAETFVEAMNYKPNPFGVHPKGRR